MKIKYLLPLTAIGTIAMSTTPLFVSCSKKVSDEEEKNNQKAEEEMKDVDAIINMADLVDKSYNRKSKIFAEGEVSPVGYDNQTAVYLQYVGLDKFTLIDDICRCFRFMDSVKPGCASGRLGLSISNPKPNSVDETYSTICIKIVADNIKISLDDPSTYYDENPIAIEANGAIDIKDIIVSLTYDSMADPKEKSYGLHFDPWFWYYQYTTWSIDSSITVSRVVEGCKTSGSLDGFFNYSMSERTQKSLENFLYSDGMYEILDTIIYLESFQNVTRE